MFKLKTLFSHISVHRASTATEHSVACLADRIYFHRLFKYDVFCACIGAGVLGAYFLFLAYLSIIGLVTDGGFGGAAIKRISEGEEPDAYFSAFVVLRSVFVTVVVVALIAFRSYFVDPVSSWTGM